MASNITRPDSAPCSSSTQDYDEKALTGKVNYPLSRQDALQSLKIESLSSSDRESQLRSFHSRANLYRNNHGLQIYDLENGLSQPRYDKDGVKMINPGQLPENQWASVQNYKNLYLTRSIYDPDAQLEEPLKPIPPAKKQTSYGKISSGGDKNSRTSSNNVQIDELDLNLFKEDNSILHVPLKTASRNRAPLKVEEAKELSSSFKSEDGSIQPRASLQMMTRSLRSVNDSDTHVHHRVDPHQRNRRSDIRSLCRVLKYLVVLLAGLVVGAGIHALVKCWTQDSSEK